MADEKRRGIDRLTERGQTRVLQRAAHQLSDAIRRLDERSDGPSLTRSPDNVEVVSRTAGDVQIALGRDMRNEIARQVAELVNLSAEQGLLRKGEEVIAREDEGGGKDDQGQQQALQEWWDQQEAAGLKPPEIQELLVDQLRALRRGMVSLAHSRKIGR